MIVLLLLLQAAPNTAAQPERWSILAPPCPLGADGEIVVCAPETVQRLPLPGEREPPQQPRRAINEPRAALENAGRPCPPGGCTGIGIDLLGLGAKVVQAVGDAGQALKPKHPGKREPIRLD